MTDETVGRQAEIGQELDQELVPVRQHRPVKRGSLTTKARCALNPPPPPTPQNHLRWGAVAAVFADPLGIVDFGPVEDGDVVVAAVVVSLHVELLKLHFNNLEEAQKNERRAASWRRRRSFRALMDSFITLSSCLFINATPQIWFKIPDVFCR